MADENKLSISDFLEDDGSLDGVIRQLNDIVELVNMLEGLIKKDKVGEWMRSLKQGSLDYKVALSGATSLAERLVTISTKLVEVRSEEAKEVARLEAIVKSENRERQREAELNQQTVGSYARLKLELKKLIEDYKAVSTESANYAQEKSRIAAQIADVTAKISIEDKTLKVLVNDYNSYTEAQKAALAELERRKIASDAAVKATKDLIASEEKLKSVRTQASTTTESGRSQIAEIKYNDELAASIKKVEEARAQADFMKTEEYQRQIAAQEKLKQEQLELVASMKLEEITAESNSGTYSQLEARYKLVEEAMKKLQYSAGGNNKELEEMKAILDSLGTSLDGMERKMGITSNRMSSRQRQWNGLTNSVYQLSRELPNLAVRADTFFLAISNNIPIFIDEFKRARTELGSFKKALAETGKAFLKSLPLAALLLVLSKWSEWVVPTFDKIFNTLEDGTLKIGAAYRKLAEEVKKVNDSFGEHMANLMMLAERWKKLDGVAAKEEFLAKYREELDRTGLAIETVNDGEKAFIENTGLITQAFIQRAKAAAAISLAQKEYVKYVNKMVEVDRKVAKEVNKQTGQPLDRDAIIEAAVKAIPGAKLMPNGDIVLSGALSDSEVNEIKVKVDVGSGIGSSYTDSEGNLHLKSASGANTKWGAEFAGTMQRYYRDYFTNGVAGQPLPEELVYAIGLSTLDVHYSDVRKTIKSIEEANVALRQGNEYVRMGIGYKDAEQGLYEMAEVTGIAGKGMKDLTKKINDMELAAMKFMHDRSLGAMGDTYAKRFQEIKDEFDEYIKEATNKISEIDKLLGNPKVPQQIKDRLTAIRAMYTQGSELAQKEQKQRENDLSLEQRVDTLNALKDNIDNRLAALKEGSDEELDLRKQSIQKAMQIEIAENQRLEPSLRRSVAAIRAKYQREEELAVRDHFIKMANYRKKDLENEQVYVNEYTQISLANKVDMERINLQIELAENSDLIEQGLISREAIIEKYNKKIEQIYLDHRAKILQAEKSYWDMMAEFVTDGSYEQLEAQLTKYDLELEAEKLQYKELIEVMPEYGRMLDEIYAKRKRLAMGQYNLGRFDAQQDIDATIFGSRPQIGEQQQSIFDLKQEWARDTYQLELFDNGQLDLTDDQLDAIYADLRRIANEMKQITGWRGTVSRVADHGLAGLLQMPDMDDTGKRKKDANGKDAWRDLSSEEYDTVSTYMSNLKDSINGVMQAYIDLAQAAYDAAQAQVDAARTVYETELEARANGYANDVEGAKRELALEKQKAKKKEEILKSAQKTQEHFNTLTQISDLITASASILKTFAAVPAVAAIMLASMWGMFAYAKIKASQVANTSSVYGEGGYELAVGGSHASGHDIHTNIQTKSGRQMVIEGGEGVGILSRKAVNQYGDLIPQVIDSFNDGSFGVSGMGYDDISAINNAKYAKEVLSLQPIMNRVDLSTIEGLISVLISKQTGMPIVLQDGSLLERKGNKTIITKKG